MKRIMLSLALLVSMSQPVWAWSCPDVTNSTTTFSCHQTVFNDSGGALTSGAVVVWDTGDSEFEDTGYPYVTTTTSADHDYPAGVVSSASIPDQSLGEIVIYGWARTNIAQGTDSATEDTPVATTTVAGQAGDWAGTAGTCYLGMLIDNQNLSTGVDATSGSDLQPMAVWVDPACEE